MPDGSSGFFPTVSLGLIKDITSSCKHGHLYSSYTADLVKQSLGLPCPARAAGVRQSSRPAQQILAAGRLLGVTCPCD